MRTSSGKRVVERRKREGRGEEEEGGNIHFINKEMEIPCFCFEIRGVLNVTCYCFDNLSYPLHTAISSFS